MTTRTRLQLGRIGDPLLRRDGAAKVSGQFDYASDLRADRMLHGATVRSPHPSARIHDIDLSEALATPGVFAVLTHDDVPGRANYGMEIIDQPVLAREVVRYQGEPVALVAADHPETARRAADRVRVAWEPLAPITSVDMALAPGARPLHGTGNLLRHVKIRHGDQNPRADVIVTGEYEMGMQDQAFLGPESGLAIPAEDGGVDLYLATQWLHLDRDQIAASLALDPALVRLHMSGIGGAFGGREDLSMQIHVCLLARYTGRPVRIVYSREESFFGHVHRHPARMRYEHGATRDGDLVYVRAEIELDGGAYASSSTAVVANAACFACGPYDVPNATIDAVVAYTNNPPCGAMRGFGAVQTAFAHESQMDRLADALGMDPLEIRLRNALGTGSTIPTGQVITGPAPVRELLDGLRAMPLPPDVAAADPREWPGGIANTTHGEGVRRGVGYAVGFKNVAYAEGFDDYSTARVRVALEDGVVTASVHSAAAEVGQGVQLVQEQIVRSELGVTDVRVLPADTSVGTSGSTSASRQTWMTGGAVQAACHAVRDALVARAAVRFDEPARDLALDDGDVCSTVSGRRIEIGDLVADAPVDETREYHHRPTGTLDPETGRGDAHVAFAFAAHRAVCDVDCELGLVRTVEIATTQDVGRIMNPLALEGQIQGGIAQGLGLALMEEIIVTDGVVRNASFTDYLIPTALDMPPVRMAIHETPHPEGPYGLNGAGEPPAIASTPAIVAAVRAACGRPLTRVPLRPQDIVGA